VVVDILTFFLLLNFSDNYAVTYLHLASSLFVIKKVMVYTNTSIDWPGPVSGTDELDRDEVLWALGFRLPFHRSSALAYNIRKLNQIASYCLSLNIYLSLRSNCQVIKSRFK